MALPEVVTDHHHARIALGPRLGRRPAAPARDGHTRHFEEVRGRDEGHDGHSRVGIEPIDLGLHGEAREMFHRAAGVEIEPPLVARMAPVTHAHVHERCRVASVGRSEDELARQTEHRDVAGRAKRDGHGGGKQQHWLSQQRSERVAQVAHEILDDGNAARIACIFAHVLDSTERAQCGATSLAGRHAARTILLDLKFEVRSQLAIELMVQPIAAQERPYAKSNDVQQSAHREPRQALRNVSRMAAERRSHCEISVSSCARPALVSE
jgi:hypothetical protein